MKQLTLIFTLLFIINCNAQNPIIDITQSELGQPDGYYSKDINNLLDPFQGTYIYTSGNTSFKIIITKKIQQYNGRYYEDLIIGEYQYIENSVEKVNTLSNLNIVYSNQSAKHAISGKLVVNNNFRRWKCPQCNLNEKRFSGGIKDRSTNRSAYITMRRTNVNGQEVMQIKISHVMIETHKVGDPLLLTFSLPLGELTLIKQ